MRVAVAITHTAAPLIYAGSSDSASSISGATARTPIRAVQQLAGHSTIAVTERYCHVLNELGKFGENVSFGEKKFG